MTSINPTVAKTFGAGTIADGAATTLVFTLANQGSNPAQSGITVGDTLPTGLALNSATPAVAYSAGCSGPATAAYNAGTRVLSGLTGIAMTSGTASCTVTVAGLTNAATQVNASCAGNPAAFTNLAASVTTTAATNASTDQCLVVTKANASVAKTFGAASFVDGAATTLVFTLTNSGTNPAQSAITIGDTLPTGLALNSATPAVAVLGRLLGSGHLLVHRGHARAVGPDRRRDGRGHRELHGHGLGPHQPGYAGERQLCAATPRRSPTSPQASRPPTPRRADPTSASW